MDTYITSPTQKMFTLPVEIRSHVKVFLENDDVRVVREDPEASVHYRLVVAGDAQGDVASPSVMTLKLQRGV